MKPHVHLASWIEVDSTECDRISDWMSDYLDGELEPAVARGRTVSCESGSNGERRQPHDQ